VDFAPAGCTTIYGEFARPLDGTFDDDFVDDVEDGDAVIGPGPERGALIMLAQDDRPQAPLRFSLPATRRELHVQAMAAVDRTGIWRGRRGRPPARVEKEIRHGFSARVGERIRHRLLDARR